MWQRNRLIFWFEAPIVIVADMKTIEPQNKPLFEGKGFWCQKYETEFF